MGLTERDLTVGSFFGYVASSYASARGVTTTEKTKEVDQQGGERTVTTSTENKTMITGGSSDPIVIKTTEPKIKGVIVVSSGASDMKVKETLYNAVQTALQVEGHQVQIICSK